MKKAFRAILGVFGVVCAYMNYSRALDFAANAIMDLLPKKEGEE